jgi:hypothetical protein
MRNTRKRDTTKGSRGKTDIKNFVDFLGKYLDMDFLPKYCYGGLELPLPRNALKHTSVKTTKKKKSDGGLVGLGFSKCTAGGVRRLSFSQGATKKKQK